MRALIVVVVLPFLELLFEETRVVGDDPVLEPVELKGVDPVRLFDLAVLARGAWPDVDVADALVKHVPVELGLELGRACWARPGAKPLVTAPGLDSRPWP